MSNEDQSSPDLLQEDPLSYMQLSSDDLTMAEQYNTPLDQDSTTMVNQQIEEDDAFFIQTLYELFQEGKQDISAQSYEQDHQSILDAITLNEEMQLQVTSQIGFIDKQLEINQAAMTEARYSANAENRFGQRVFVHKAYNDPVQYFDQSELLEKTTPVAETSNNTPANEEEEEDEEEIEEEIEEEEDIYPEEDDDDNNVDSEKSLPNKAWSRYERNRLLAAIQSEAKRTIAYDYMKKNEAWRVWDVDKINQTELENFPVGRIDWERVSSIHVKTRTANECLMQWTTQEHPLINKTPWSKQESERLSQLVDEIGLNGQWERIASELDTNRTISQCFSHYMADKNNKAARSLKWTPEEDKKLTDAVKIFGNCNWQQVAAMLKGRTGQQCLHRWTKSINPAIKRTKWTPEEAKLLQRAVQLYGNGNWKKVQRLIPGRTDMQCRERWVNIEQPAIVRTKMTDEEVEQLVELVNEVGPKWSYIMSFFPGRTDNNMLREYNLYMNRQKKTANLNKKETKKLGAKQKNQQEKAEKKRKLQEEKQKKKEAREAKKQKIAEPPKKKSRKRKATVADDDSEDEDEAVEKEPEQEQVVRRRSTRYSMRQRTA